MTLAATIVRAHQHSAGGLSTGLRGAPDALGNPWRLRLGPGQRHGMTEAAALLDGFAARWVIAGTAHDADRFRAALEDQGSTAVIPCNPSRARVIACDPDLCKERHPIERFFNKVTHFRRIAPRHEKTAASFLAMAHLAAAMVWLR